MVFVAIISPIVVAGFNAWFTTSVDSRARMRTDTSQQQMQLRLEQAQRDLQHESDMRWCRLFNLYVDADQPPPTTERGKEQLKEFVILYNSLGCKRQ